MSLSYLDELCTYIIKLMGHVRRILNPLKWKKYHRNHLVWMAFYSIMPIICSLTRDIARVSKFQRWRYREIPSRWKGVCMEGSDFKKSSCSRWLTFFYKSSMKNLIYIYKIFQRPYFGTDKLEKLLYEAF